MTKQEIKQKTFTVEETKEIILEYLPKVGYLRPELHQLPNKRYTFTAEVDAKVLFNSVSAHGTNRKTKKIIRKLYSEYDFGFNLNKKTSDVSLVLIPKGHINIKTSDLANSCLLKLESQRLAIVENINDMLNEMEVNTNESSSN